MPTRRSVLTGAIASVVAGGALSFSARSYARIKGANDRLRRGSHGRQRSRHGPCQCVRRRAEYQVTHLVDVDSTVLHRRGGEVAQKYGATKLEGDYRRVLDNKVGRHPHGGDAGSLARQSGDRRDGGGQARLSREALRHHTLSKAKLLVAAQKRSAGCCRWAISSARASKRRSWSRWCARACSARSTQRTPGTRTTAESIGVGVDGAPPPNLD